MTEHSGPIISAGTGGSISVTCHVGLAEDVALIEYPHHNERLRNTHGDIPDGHVSLVLGGDEADLCLVGTEETIRMILIDALSQLLTTPTPTGDNDG